jgi:hypothetical protein
VQASYKGAYDYLRPREIEISRELAPLLSREQDFQRDGLTVIACIPHRTEKKTLALAVFTFFLRRLFKDSHTE